jgi:Asp-tRNA(Asn)/Glu-tRNA(Gln) amidotransferase A subunit family amidase
VECTRIVLDALAQRDDYSRDSTFSSYEPGAASESSIAPSIIRHEEVIPPSPNKPLSGVKVGLSMAFSIKECPHLICQSWSQAAQILENHGAEIVQVSGEDISPELIQESLAAYYLLVCAEASSNLRRWFPIRHGGKYNW